MFGELVADRGGRAHLETFGGCLLGQLCPPSLLVATSVLEALFFVQHGLRSVSLSYAQQTHPVQDIEALAALDRLATELLPDVVDRHIVLYTYMGVFPRTGRRGTVAARRQRADRGPGRCPAADREDRDRGAPHPDGVREPGGADRGRRLGGPCPPRHRSTGPRRGRLLAGPGRGQGSGARRAGALLRRGSGAGQGLRVRHAGCAVLPPRRQCRADAGRDRRRGSSVLGAGRPDAGADPRGPAAQRQ